MAQIEKAGLRSPPAKVTLRYSPQLEKTACAFRSIRVIRVIRGGLTLRSARNLTADYADSADWKPGLRSLSSPK